MDRQFSPQGNFSDRPKLGSTEQQVSPLWCDAYGSLGAPGGTAILREGLVTTGMANLQQMDSPPVSVQQRLQVLFQSLLSGGTQAGERVDPRELANLLRRIDPQQLSEIIRQFQGNGSQQLLQNLITNLQPIDPNLVSQIRALFESAQSPGSARLPGLEGVGARLEELRDLAQIERTPDRVRSRILMLLDTLNSGGFQQRQAAEAEIVNTFGAAALPFLRQVLRHQPTEEMRQYAEKMIARITGANERTWSGRFALDGSGRITAITYADVNIIHTEISWNGLGEVDRLSLFSPYDPTGGLDFGSEGLRFQRTTNGSGYQVTRLDEEPLPPGMRTAQHIMVNNETGVITVTWANGQTTNFHPVAYLLRLRNDP